jgi:hypothetical protein
MFIRNRVLFAPDGGTSGGSATSTDAPSSTGSTAGTTAATSTATTTATDKTTTSMDWRAMVTDPTLQEHAKRFNSLDDLVKGNVELRSDRDKLKSTAIIKPGKDAKPEDVAAYRKAMGVPEKPEDYKFEVAEGVEPTETDKAFQSTMAKIFHDAGISSEAAAALNKGWNTFVAAQAKATKEADEAFAKDAETQLRKEWGNDFDRNTEFAKRALKQLAGDGADDLLNLETKAGRFLLDDPRMLKVFAQVGREMGEGSLGSVVSDNDRTGIQAEIDTLQSQKFEAMQKGDSQKANELDQKQAALYAKLNGNRPIVGTQGRAA